MSCISAQIKCSISAIMHDGNLPKKRRNALKKAILTKESRIFIKINGLKKLSTRAPLFYDFLHFKGCSYLDHKISFNLSVQVTIFLVFITHL